MLSAQRAHGGRVVRHWDGRAPAECWTDRLGVGLGAEQKLRCVSRCSLRHGSRSRRRATVAWSRS